MVEDALELLACPRCGGALRKPLRCASCGAEFGAPAGVPELRLPSDVRTEAVREFYAQAPSRAIRRATAIPGCGRERSAAIWPGCSTRRSPATRASRRWAAGPGR